MLLYHLSLIDQEASCGGNQETFHIGVFLSAEDAERTAKAYLASVPGFKDFSCIYSVTPKKTHGNSINDTVYWVQSWCLNENQDEVDLVESDDFSCRADAEASLRDMKNRYDRTEWTISRGQIGHCDWQEGFERFTC